MMATTAVLWMAVLAATAAPSSATPISDSQQRATWSVDQVRQWATEHAAVANMLDAERRAATCGLDRDNARPCAQAGMVQGVLAALARHDRNQSAGEAMTVYYQIVGLETQLTLLDQAHAELSSLVAAAEAAERLELPDGDPIELRRRRSEIEDRRLQARYGVKKLRTQLARLTGQSRQLANAAELTASLTDEVTQIAPDAAVEQAWDKRDDLQAVRILCRCMSEDSLPAARALMGVVQPGLGLSLLASSKCLLPGWGDDVADLGCRRSQCRQLLQATRDNIEDQVILAELDVRQAVERRANAEANAALVEQHAKLQAKAEQLEQAAPGSHSLAKLISLEAQGEAVQRRIDLAVAEIKFRQSRGMLAD